MKFPKSPSVHYPFAGDSDTKYFVKFFENGDLEDLESDVNVWLFNPILDVSDAPWFHPVESEMLVTGSGNNKVYIMKITMMMIGGDIGDWNP